MAHFKGDISKDVDFGFYLIMTNLSNRLGVLSNHLKEFGSNSGEGLSELFEANK